MSSYNSHPAGHSSKSSASTPRRPWQFSLTHLLAMVTIACVAAAIGRHPQLRVWAYNPLTGFWAYIGCASLFMIVWRTRSDIPTERNDLPTSIITSILIAAAAAIVFIAVCIITMNTYVNYYVEANLVGLLTPPHAAWVLALSMVLGTLPAIPIYWLSWPRMRSNFNQVLGKERELPWP